MAQNQRSVCPRKSAPTATKAMNVIVNNVIQPPAIKLNLPNPSPAAGAVANWRNAPKLGNSDTHDALAMMSPRRERVGREEKNRARFKRNWEAKRASGATSAAGVWTNQRVTGCNCPSFCDESARGPLRGQGALGGGINQIGAVLIFTGRNRHIRFAWRAIYVREPLSRQ
jgi:hypothetical protein